MYTLERSPTSSHPFVPVNLWLLNQSRASGQLKLPTGKHSKRLPSMNIYPEVPGEIPQHRSGLSLRVCLPLPPQRAVSGFVSAHKSSLPTPLPRSPHCESFNLEWLFHRHINSQDTACLEFNRGIDGSVVHYWYRPFMNTGVWRFSFKLHGSQLMTEQGQISWTKLDKHNMVMKRSSSIHWLHKSINNWFDYTLQCFDAWFLWMRWYGWDQWSIIHHVLKYITNLLADITYQSIF